MNNYDVLVLKQKPKFINTERMIFINEKLKQIEKILIEERGIELGKRCSAEYIVYEFYFITNDNSVVRRMCKYHYTDSTLLVCKKKSKNTLINKPLREVIDKDVYNLLLKGYDLITE